MASQYFDSFPSSDIILSDDPADDIASAPTESNSPHSSDNEPHPQLSFIQAKTLLKGFNRFEPHNGQVSTLLDLYTGDDYILIAPCRWGKTIVVTGLACLLQRLQDTITLILSPLKAIQQDQSTALQKELGAQFRPFVLNGESNTPEHRHEIAIGAYTHIWLSAEVAIGERCDTVEKRRAISKRFSSGYEDHGDFLSVLQNETCMYSHFISLWHESSTNVWDSSKAPHFGYH
jgi:hypothetical protein